MATISEKIKRTLADIEVLRKSLNAIDEDHAEAEAVQSVLNIRRAELGLADQQLQQTREEIAKADAEHTRWREVTASEQAKGNARIDQLQERLRALEQQTTEAQAKFDNIIAGVAALSQRLKVGDDEIRCRGID
jgi:chromosome segregation ATPase